MNTLPPGRPDPDEYAEDHERYIALVPEGDILTVLGAQLDDTLTFLQEVTEDEGNTRHPPYTWSVKEVVGHLIDCERVFGARAFRFARGDATPLPGFDENEYVRQAKFDARLMRDLAEEFEMVRRSHLCFFRQLNGAMWLRSGIANDKAISVRAIAYAIAGHMRHHVAILWKRLART
jgi:hypothetical protein